MLLRTCFALFLVAKAWAQPAPQAKPSQKGDAPITRSSFTAKGLHREDDLTDLFVGNFADVTFDRGSLVFSQLFEMYLEAYSHHCGGYLPANKVEMTTQVCNDGPDPLPMPGQPPPLPHPCMSWRTVSLGYADPALYAAKRQSDAGQAANQLKDIVGSMKNLMRPAIDIAEVTADTDALVRLNACVGPGLRRFQENLARFSLGKQPLLLPGSPPPVTPSAQPPGVLADSDYNRLLEDLIADQARTWAMNRYVPGSTSRVIVAHDPTGAASKIMARYLFSSPLSSGRAQGSVTVSFTDGMPQCIFFSDAPNSCQPPNRRIVAKYASGGYLDTPPGASPAGAQAPLPPSRDPAVQARARAEASVRGNICVPDDLLAEWRNPPPGGKMEALQRQLKQSLRERATLRGFDQTKWMTVNSRFYSTWNPAGPFRGVVTATDGGSCAVGQHEFLALKP
jgi:hypothetical protein